MNNNFRNFKNIVSDNFNELKDGFVKSMREEGKSDAEINAFFESDDFVYAGLEIFDKLAPLFTESIEKTFIEDANNDKKRRADFLELVRAEWGDGVDWMKQYILKYVVICDALNQFKHKNGDILDNQNNNTEIALGAILAKALLVYSEIICLLENGYPNGPNARFRDIFELWVIAEFIRYDTDDMAKKYIESREDSPASEADHYKWAKDSKRFDVEMSPCTHCGRKKEITISAIRNEVAKSAKERGDNITVNHLKKIHNAPNVLIHPSAKGVFGRTSIVLEDTLNIGRTNIGLAVPAINASIYVNNIAKLYLTMHQNPMGALGLVVLNEIHEKIKAFFDETEIKQKERIAKDPSCLFSETYKNI